jgi:hypothetical protein
MKKANVCWAAILMAVLCISGTVLAYSGDGDGTAEYPYQIANKADLLELAADTGNYDKCFILTEYIDLTGETFTTAVIAPDTDTADEMEEFQGIPFTGIFDGNGCILFNLTINDSTLDFIGLFGAVGAGGQVKNLVLENVNITGRSYVGGLVGDNDGSLTNCYVTGGWVIGGGGAHSRHIGGLVGWNRSGALTDCYAASWIFGFSSVGGLVGENDSGTLTGCYATGSVTGTSAVGGLVGWNESGTLTECHATGSASGGHYAGGLVGWNESGTLTGCHASGTVAGSDTGGGLMGYNASGQLSSCYATGSVSGNNGIGGLVGDNRGSLTSCYATGLVSGTYYNIGGLVGVSEGSLTNCYATGSVTGNDICDSVGGLMGQNRYGSLTNCYATGSVSGRHYLGGLVGWYFPGNLTACFWDINTSVTSDGVGNLNPDPAGVTGKTTVEMKTLSTFTNAGWDFSVTDGDAADWAMPANSYPQLAWPITGDIAGLYGVNYVDFAVFAAHWEQTDCPDGCENADLNNNGIVNIDDLILFANNWLKGI